MLPVGWERFVDDASEFMIMWLNTQRAGTAISVYEPPTFRAVGAAEKPDKEWLSIAQLACTLFLTATLGNVECEKRKQAVERMGLQETIAEIYNCWLTMWREEWRRARHDVHVF